MIVIADTSPLNYLIQIDCDSLLPRLYTHVHVPVAVMEELSHPHAPASVQHWLKQVPGWLEIQSIHSTLDASLAFLDYGEREAIQLAQEQHADLLLIDEHQGRIEARRRGIATTGTLGVLLAAAEKKLIDVEAAYQRLMEQTTFRIAPALQAEFLKRIQQP
jgi:predicted nucleic acid-binding protein